MVAKTRLALVHGEQPGENVLTDAARFQIPLVSLGIFGEPLSKERYHAGVTQLPSSTTTVTTTYQRPLSILRDLRSASPPFTPYKLKSCKGV
jgi:hypothetical protein